MKVITRKPQEFVLEEGSVVDGYVVENLVAHHGAAELAYDAVGPDGEAATLVVGWRRLPDRHAWARVRRLARTRGRLEHRALLPVRAVGDHAGRPYLAMDRYPEKTFEDLLQESPLPAARALELLAPVGEALDLAHAEGLVHQRISGKSLLVDGDAVLLDGFGIAGGPRDVTLHVVGAHEVRYSSPEELRDEPLEPASNTYSLAALLVHAVTGRMPYEGAATAQAYGHLMEPPPVPSERVPELGAAFDGVIAQGMAKDPADRPTSAHELFTQAATALAVELPVNAAPAADDERGQAKPGVSALARVAKRTAAAAVIVAGLAGLAAGIVLDPFEATRASTAGSGADARALERLDGQRTLLRARLSAATTPQRQAAAAADLADAYGRVARAAGSPRLAAVAGAAERAYRELGAAALSGAAERYAGAADEIGRAEGRLAVARAR